MSENTGENPQHQVQPVVDDGASKSNNASSVYRKWSPEEDEEALMEWLEEGGGDGYAPWRNAGPKTAGKAKSNGKTKMKIAAKIATALEAKGRVGWTAQQVYNKVKQYEQKYRAVTYCNRLNRTGEGVTRVDKMQGHKSIRDVVDEVCPNFEQLHTFIGDQVANNPPYTGSTGDGVDATGE
ncbi:hypothetical protein HK102_008062, partial [Quaeritorhiza haematococci]